MSLQLEDMTKEELIKIIRHRNPFGVASRLLYRVRWDVQTEKAIAAREEVIGMIPDIRVGNYEQYVNASKKADRLQKAADKTYQALQSAEGVVC